MKLLTFDDRELLLDGDFDQYAAGREAVAGARVDLSLRVLVDLVMYEVLWMYQARTLCAFSASLAFFLGESRRAATSPQSLN